MASVQAQLRKYKIRPKKWLGQNFLLDENVLEQITILCDLKRDEVVVEIGAGLGALTTRLAPRVSKVLAIELDKTLASLLKNEIIKDGNVKVVNQDILKLNFPEVAELYGGKLKVVGNIPYSISAPLVFKLIDCRAFLSVGVLMFQKEVADRIVANPGTKNYGILSVFSQVSAVVSKELVVPREYFYPEPRVDSAVVKFLFSETPLVEITNEKIFKSVVKASFAQRRKTLRNALKNSASLNIPFSDILSGVKACGIDPQRRGETLGLEEFRELSNCLAEWQSS